MSCARLASSANWIAVACTLVTLSGRIGIAQTMYRQITVDSGGQLRIVLSTSRVVWPPKDSTVVAFEQLRMSADRRAVGWVEAYHSCCTSYPIPLKLVVLRGDHRCVVSNGLPIWQWAFGADSRQLVIRQAPTHGRTVDHYELRDFETERLIATADVDAFKRTRLPRWALPVALRR